MTAQNILDEEKKTSSACGTACGASDETKIEEQTPTACGTACGASDGEETKKEETPTACGSSCGAGE